MADQQEAPAAAAAAARNDIGDAILAQKLHAVEKLVSVYGFPSEAAQEAVDHVVDQSFTAHDDDDSADGAPTMKTIDIAACYNYILESGLAPDQGGPVIPIENCPHVNAQVKIGVEQLPFMPQAAVCTYIESPLTRNAGSTKSAPPPLLKSERMEDGVSCAATENWLCLECGVVRCSRYCNGHAVQHWYDTRTSTQPTTAVASSSSLNDDSSAVAGHCVMVSLTDLSVWCHVCEAYLSTSPGSPTGRRLAPLVRQLERLKFMSPAVASHLTMVQDGPEKKKPKTIEQDSEVANGAKEQVEKETLDSEGDNDSPEEKEDENYDEGENEQSEEEDSDAQDLLRRLAAIAQARGIPLEWLVLQAYQDGYVDDEDDDQPLDYPFGAAPQSLEDVANFIQSDKCRSIVILAGAGMSVASGIPDFRSADGLYATLDADLLTADEAEREAIRADPTVSLQQDMFLQNPYPCLELQREFILGTREQRWKATLAHRFIELLHEKTGKLVRHYTQNIDGLEDQCTKLPREKMIAVHGSMDRAECARCQSEADFDEFCNAVQRQIKDLSGKDPTAPKESTPIVCKVCGHNAMKPAIVLFKSSLPKVFFESVPRDIQDVDLLIVIGTSLRVAPACSLVPQVPKTAMRVLVNREPAGAHLGMIFDQTIAKRDYFAQGECDAVFLELMDQLGWIDDLKPLLANDLLPASTARLLEDYLAENYSDK
jgi:NAD+-dependent protein deacetylase sirtuin 2